MTDLIGPCKIDCDEKCDVPDGGTLSPVPVPRHRWTDVLTCPHNCGRAFLINVTTNVEENSMGQNKVVNTERQAQENPALMLARNMAFGRGRDIEAQEAEGQAQLCQSQVLPIELNPEEARRHLYDWGFKFSTTPIPNETCFQSVEFPAGWSIKPTEHSMWSRLCDLRGRERAAIFYKAAFYDRSAHLRLTPAVRIERLYEKPTDYHIVKLQGVEVFRTLPFPAWTRENAESQRELEKMSEKAAQDYVSEHYPNAQDLSAYWE